MKAEGKAQWRLPPWADDDRKQLETVGLMARVPYIRSSDYELASQDEFLYYLKRRLGLISALSYSPALSKGSWFHIYAARAFDPAAPTPEAALEIRNLELATALSAGGGSATTIEAFMATEREDMLTAGAWWEAVSTQPIGKHGTLLEYLKNPRFRVLGTELSFRTQLPGIPTAVLACKIDLLLYDTLTKMVWIVDWKTTSDDTETRLSTCLYEFQTNQYLTIMGILVTKRAFQKKCKLPADTQLGGMMHFAFKKPTIKLSGKDRDYTVDTTKPTAPRTYHGDPKPENYRRRVVEWLSGTGEYVGGKGPVNPVNFSVVDAGLLLDKRRMYRYQSDLNWLMDLALRPANPYLFRANINATKEYGDLSSWAPFYFTNPAEWPAVIKAGNFVIGHRDAEEQYVCSNDSIPDLSAKRGYRRLTAAGRSKLALTTHPSISRYLSEALNQPQEGQQEGGLQAAVAEASGTGAAQGERPGFRAGAELLSGYPAPAGPTADSTYHR